jgi:IS4 transposase
VDKTTGVLCDQIGKLETYKSKKEYPDKLRRIKFYDQEINQDFVFITNNIVLEASEIALLYKKRWEVELFFYGKQFIMQSKRFHLFEAA